MEPDDLVLTPASPQVGGRSAAGVVDVGVVTGPADAVRRIGAGLHRAAAVRAGPGYALALSGLPVLRPYLHSYRIDTSRPGLEPSRPKRRRLSIRRHRLRHYGVMSP